MKNVSLCVHPFPLWLRKLLILISFSILGAVSLHAQTQVPAWKKISIPKLPVFHPQEPKRIELPNGMVVFLQEDHELPTIDGIARIRGGSRSEPVAKVGLVSLYGEVWRTSGTKAQSGDQLDDYLEARAAKVETSGNADSTIISLSCLKDDFNDVFKVFSELLLGPEFREEKLDLAKREAFDGISRRNDEISDIARRESAKLAYGPHNPYARQEEYATIAAVTRQDLIEWHHAYVHPNNIILGFVGDFDSVQMEATLRQAFGEWSKGPAAAVPEMKFESAKPGYYLVKKEDVNQSSIHMVGLGTDRRNPDYYAIEVFNEVFAGGFSSRLIQSIRTAKGLAYSVGGGIGTRFDHPGILQLAMSTKSSTTVESVQALFTEIDNLNKNPITEAEIARAKDTILNAFVFNFDTPDKVLRERMAYEYYGYPADFLEQYRSGIEKVTAADVNRIIPKYLHKDQLAVLVAGKPSDFDKPLSSLGPVTDVDITIPPPPSDNANAAPSAEKAEPKQSNAEGKALATKVAQSLGGNAKLQAVKSEKANFTVQQQGATIQAESTIVFPDQMKVDLQTPQGNFSIVATPTSAFMSAAGRGVQDMPPSRKTDSLEQIRRDPVYLAQHFDDPAFSFFASGTDKSAGTELAVVDVAGPGVTIRWFVDTKTGKIIRETYKVLTQSGPVEGETEFSDWKPVEGLNLPFHRANKQNGQDSSSVQYNRIQINPQVDPAIFEKPAAAK
jgi:zinc protease